MGIRVIGFAICVIMAMPVLPVTSRALAETMANGATVVADSVPVIPDGAGIIVPRKNPNPANPPQSITNP